MASKDTAEKAESTVKLVSPSNPDDVREVEPGSATDVRLRWDGFLPVEQQKLEAPKVEGSGSPKTVGTNA